MFNLLKNLKYCFQGVYEKLQSIRSYLNLLCCIKPNIILNIKSLHATKVLKMDILYDGQNLFLQLDLAKISTVN